MTKIPIIVFTHKRALQLDSFISSAINNFPDLKLPLNVIYHYDKNHHSSYLKLFNKFKNKLNVLQRIDYKKNFKNAFLSHPLNIIWFYRFKWIRVYYDNFKFLLEKTLSNLDSENVILSTDDQLFYKKTLIPIKALSLISQYPNHYTYRFTSNINFKGQDAIKPDEYDFFYDNNMNFFKWDYKKISKKNFWKYNFNVDGTIYNRNSLLKLIRPFIYNMPTTLEGIGLWESRLRGYFRYCLGSEYRSFIGVQASNIQTISDTPSAQFNLDLMKNLYLDNFEIAYQNYKIQEEQYIFIPKKIPLIKNRKIHYLSENGIIE